MGLLNEITYYYCRETTWANIIHQRSALESANKGIDEIPEAVKLKRQHREEEDIASRQDEDKGEKELSQSRREAIPTEVVLLTEEL